MNELAFAIWLEIYFQDMAELLDVKGPRERAFFLQDQREAVALYPFRDPHPVDLYF